MKEKGTNKLKTQNVHILAQCLSRGRHHVGPRIDNEHGGPRRGPHENFLFGAVLRHDFAPRGGPHHARVRPARTHTQHTKRCRSSPSESKPHYRLMPRRKILVSFVANGNTHFTKHKEHNNQN
jgi:hypothetical protein